MVNHEFTSNWFYGKMVLPGVTGGKKILFLWLPFLIFFLPFLLLKTNPEMTCNPFHTELTLTTNKRNNLSIHPLVSCRLAVAPLRTRKELTLSSEVARTGTDWLETRSGGRELQKRESLLYVGIDLHKESHTAVMVNCWNEKLEVVVIENKPSEFKKLAEKVNKKSSYLGLEPIYGLENAYGYGRSLAVWLIEKGYTVKDINPALAYDQRKSAPMLRKNDEHDAYCVATVLINQLHTLPDAKPMWNSL